MLEAYQDRLPAPNLVFALGYALVGGMLSPLAVLFSGVVSGGWFGIVVVGPFVEEVVKTLGIAFLLASHPYWVRSRAVLAAMGGLCGLIFAIVENVVYQQLYLADLEPERLLQVMSLRWTVCVMLHVCCSSIAAWGLGGQLEQAQGRFLLRLAPVATSEITSLGVDYRAPMRKDLPLFQPRLTYGWLSAAIVLHGSYNLIASIWSPSW